MFPLLRYVLLRDAHEVVIDQSHAALGLAALAETGHRLRACSCAPAVRGSGAASADLRRAGPADRWCCGMPETSPSLLNRFEASRPFAAITSEQQVFRRGSFSD